MGLSQDTVAKVKQMIRVSAEFGPSRAPLPRRLTCVPLCPQNLKCGKVSLSLDAWTSSNQIAFLAIVMTFVSNDDELGASSVLFVHRNNSDICLNCADEFLIDFREIQGAHTGENMADIVWKTMQLYDLPGKVRHCALSSACEFALTQYI